MFTNLRRNLALGLMPKGDNKFYEQFLAAIGNAFTRYDTNAKSYIEKGFLYNPDVYSVIQQQATKAASIPWSVKLIQNERAKADLDRLSIQTKGVLTPQQLVKKRILETKAFKEKELDFPLERPNALQTWSEFKALQKTFLKTTGNVYIYIKSPKDGANTGVPQSVYLLPSHLMKIVLKAKGDFDHEESPVGGYMLIEGNGHIPFEEEEIIHIKYANPDYDIEGSHLYGLSPLRAALRNIQSSNEAIDNNNKTLKNGGAFGFIHGKGTALDPAQALQVRDRLEEMDKSPERMAKIAGISAEVGFTRISLTTDELKPFDYLKYDQKTICNVLGWSDKLLNNDEGGKYDNVKQFRKQVITDNIIPDNVILDQAIQEGIIRKFKGYENAILESNYDELPEMQEDINELVKWLSIARADGVITLNEYRQAIKYPASEDPNMDIHTVASDIIPLSEAIMTDLRIDEPTGV